MHIKKMLFAAAAGVLGLCLAGAPVNADAGNTITLSGHIEGDCICPEGTEKIILSGAQMDEGAVLEVHSEAELVIADGTKNDLYMISAEGMTDITGGGTLNLGFGILAFGYDVMFDHTGEINITGSLAGAEANIICNSGTINIKSEDEDAAAVSCIQGNLIINGGALNVTSKGVGVASSGELAVNGGNISIKAGDVSLMALNDMGISISDDMLPKGSSIQQLSGENGTYFALTDASTGELNKTVDISSKNSEAETKSSKDEFAAKTEEMKDFREEKKAIEEAEAAGQLIEQGTEPETGDVSRTQPENSSNTPAKTTQTTQKPGAFPVAVLIIVIVGIAAAAGAAAVIVSRRSNKEKRR